MANYVGGRLHICHLTTKGGVELIRWAKGQGFEVTAEVTPHHLLLTDAMAENFDPTYKVNPPLRSQADVSALRAGLADGTIDVVATDHAPHSSEDKDCEWNAAAFGMVGLETALSVVVETMIDTGLMDWKALVSRMSTTPAAIGGYKDHGSMEIGSLANFIVVEPEERWKVDRNKLFSRSSNTPFHNLSLPAVVRHTFFRGVHVLKNGQLTGMKYE
jgi:dihydroorotase